jgi:hypothetical protein
VGADVGEGEIVVIVGLVVVVGAGEESIAKTGVAVAVARGIEYAVGGGVSPTTTHAAKSGKVSRIRANRRIVSSE